MNFLRNTRSLLSQIALRCKAPATRCYDHGKNAAAPRLMQDLGLASRGSSLRRQSASLSRRSFVLRWYHDPWKASAATAIALSATAVAACSRYDREILPCTNRSHKAELLEKNMIVDPRDPRIVRVRLIAEKIVHAAHRGLGIYYCNDAPMLRVTEKKCRQRWGKAPPPPPPHTGHLRGLNWEVTLVRNPDPNAGITPSGQIVVTTGLFDWFKTDDEIAYILAHELGHVVARKFAEITNISPLLRKIFSRRKVIDADYIGILLLGAAGFHPQWALVVMDKMAKFERFFIIHPNSKKRLQLLSEAKTMKEALELYREVTAMDKVTDCYLR